MEDGQYDRLVNSLDESTLAYLNDEGLAEMLLLQAEGGSGVRGTY